MIRARAAGPSDSPATILLADDDEERAAPVRRLLEDAAYRVLQATEGAATVRLLSAHDVDLALIRSQLPDIDGFDLCRAIKQAPATQHIPLVVVLEADDDRQRRRAIEAGADNVAVEPIDAAALPSLVDSLVRIGRLQSRIAQLEGVVLTLARAVEDRDQLGSGHAEKVAHWAMQLGRAIALPDAQLTLLYKAALLHDVGTVGVPVEVLTKAGRLDPTEFNDVKRHPLVGEEIVRPLSEAELLLPAVRHHHERIDGAGYPDGLAGESIPLFARIIAIADAFIAMTSDRPYRRRRPREDAISTLRQGAGKQWDAALVDRFLSLLAESNGDAVAGLKSAG